MKTYKGAGIALFKKNPEGYAILLGKRTINPEKDKWSIFGGKSEPIDKTPFETAEREFNEESGISFDKLNTRPYGECQFKYPFFKWTTFLFEVSEDFQIPELFCFEFSELRFIPLKESKKYNVAFGVRKEIRTFKKNKKKLF